MKRRRKQDYHIKSKVWQDLQVFYDFGADHPWDQSAELFPEYDRGENCVPFDDRRVIIPGHYQSGDQTHHISGGILGTPRWDVPTNLLRVSFWTHRWMEHYTRDGFAVAAVAKIKAKEWDTKRMAEIMRVDSCLGWLLPENGFHWPFVAELVKQYESEI